MPILPCPHQLPSSALLQGLVQQISIFLKCYAIHLHLVFSKSSYPNTLGTLITFLLLQYTHGTDNLKFPLVLFLI